MSVLVPIDLSHPSRGAVAFAAQLATALHTDVRLLHVADQVPTLDQLAQLHALAEPLRRSGVTTRLRTAQGDPAATICAMAERHDTAWVVMGTRGALISQEGGGSVARAVMQGSNRPVAAVRPRDDAAQPVRGGLLALVAPQEATRAIELAHLLGQGVQAGRQGPGPGERLLQPHPGGPPLPREATAIVAFDPGCVNDATWCSRLLLEDSRRAVVLVSSLHCGCHT